MQNFAFLQHTKNKMIFFVLFLVELPSEFYAAASSISRANNFFSYFGKKNVV
jgi:hypothetical protein